MEDSPAQDPVSTQATSESLATEVVSASPAIASNPTESSTLLADTPKPSSQRTVSDTSSMATSTNSTGGVAVARNRPTIVSASSIRDLNPDITARMEAFRQSRQGAPPSAAAAGRQMTPAAALAAAHGSLAPGMANMRLSPARPQPGTWNSAPMSSPMRSSPKPSLGARRGLALPGGLPGAPAGRPSLQLPKDSAADGPESKPADPTGSLFDKFSSFVDTKNGTLKFVGKAIIHGQGVDFSSGNSFSISLDEVDTLDELGKGNYGTVYKVKHSRPRARRPGQGLAGNKASSALLPQSKSANPATNGAKEFQDKAANASGSTTGAIMAMKEIRLELDEAKFAAIIMELDILHRCVSPFIVDFYGAFFQEGAVYICMEYMDGGSIDKLYHDKVPENVLQKIALGTVLGLKALKDEHNIIHRDVKPTNILVNQQGQVKLCDFGVSGNLVASIAKTNIGCQSYMAPERIATGGMAQAGSAGGTYSVQSDIWSLGLTILECAMGQYPYPPETYNNIFSQLSAIVDGEPPDLPEDEFTPLARDFVRGCLNKIPKLRPTYAMLLQHGWLAQLTGATESSPATKPAEEVYAELSKGDPDLAAWVTSAIEKRNSGAFSKVEKPALHAAPLDAVSSPGKVVNSLEMASNPAT